MMEEDSRFPNRKKKSWDEPILPDRIPDEAWEELTNESEEAEPLPVSGYRIIGSASGSPGGKPVEADLSASTGASGEAPAQGLIDVSAGAEGQAPGAAPPVLPPASQDARPGRNRKLAESASRVYLVLGVVFVLLLGGLIAVTFLFFGIPSGRYDLGPLTSSVTGLQGHLFIQWDKKLEYRLTIKPGDPDQQAGFALAVFNPRRPLLIAIHLKDSAGFELCSKEIALKSDAGNGAAPAGAGADSPAGKTDAGMDTFQNQIGPDGQIAAITSQGTLPCSVEAYEKAANWNFSTNFPSLAEQAEWLSRQKDIEAAAKGPSPAEAAARKRIAAKAAARLLPFSLEGDDAIVDFDISRGVIQTRGRKTFLVDKATAAGADPRWQDYPVSIHYRCDRSSSCMLRDAGVGVLRASLGR